MTDTGADIQVVQSARARLFALLRRRDTVARQKWDVVFLFLLRGGGAAFAFLTQIAIARWAGADVFGIYAVAWTWIIVLGTLSQAGFGISITRFVARYEERGRSARAWQAVIFSGLFVLGLGLVTALVAAAVIYSKSVFGGTVLNVTLLLAMVAVPFYALSELGKGVLRGLGESVMAYAPGYLLRPALLFSFIGAAFWFSLPIDGTLIVGAVGVSLVIVALVQWARILRHRNEAGAKVPRRWHAGHWLAISLPMILVDGHFLLVSYMDLLVLDLFVAPEVVAVYFAAVKIVALIWFVPFAVSGIGARVLAKDFERQDGQDFERSVRRFAHWSFWPTLVLAVLMSVFGDRILMLFGAGFEAGLPVLRILALGLVFQAAAGPIKFLMTMTSEQNASAVILCSTAALNIALNFALIPIWGLEGAAIATVATQILATGLMVFQARRKLGVWSFVSLSMPFSRVQ